MNSYLSQYRWSTRSMICMVMTALLCGYLCHTLIGNFRRVPEQNRIALPTNLPSTTDIKSSSGPATAAAVAPDPMALWERLKNEPRSESVGTEMANILAAMARRDPTSAMKLAMMQPNLKMRHQLRDAVLRSWATVDPSSAAAWALHQDLNNDRLAGMYEVFQGASHEPGAAAALALSLYRESPNLPPDFANMAITAIAKQGAYEQALQLAIEANKIVSNPAWLNTAFDSWAAYQPDAASRALAQITDPHQHFEAFIGLVTGWRVADPAGLATYAATMSPGDERSTALKAGLLRWVEIDPVTASNWANSLPAGPEMDAVASAVAFIPTLIVGHPDTAVSWATSISDADTRANVLRSLGSQLSLNNISMARNLVASNLFSNAQDRSSFSEGVHAPPGRY